MALLTPRVEPLAHKYLVHRTLQTTHALVHAVGGIEDHVHMAVRTGGGVRVTGLPPLKRWPTSGQAH
jgi:hypothetical protein